MKMEVLLDSAQSVSTLANLTGKKPKFKQCKLLQALPNKIVDLANITISDGVVCVHLGTRGTYCSHSAAATVYYGSSIAQSWKGGNCKRSLAIKSTQNTSSISGTWGRWVEEYVTDTE
ncbi:unnamed protein product [Rangifer tarandus platyrhynchus]|uniref:Uncharacterized protein n=1 Tax=Rangifer tarandus platyrhynchus TaxID=3082113 RepID=A0ABN9A8J4_RANTA|nr:unnamed protein product [Rangifer tarandus platyrhynchus]